jgi:hypothetical protein
MFPVKSFMRGCVSDEDTHTHSSTSCRFLAHLQLIIIIMMEVLYGPRGNTW